MHHPSVNIFREQDKELIDSVRAESDELQEKIGGMETQPEQASDITETPKEDVELDETNDSSMSYEEETISTNIFTEDQYGKTYLHDVYEYEVLGANEVKIKKYLGNDETVLRIPSQIKGATVTELGYLCFQGLENLRQLYIPNTLEVIGPAAFNQCSNLEIVEFEKDSRVYKFMFPVPSSLFSTDKACNTSSFNIFQFPNSCT